MDPQGVRLRSERATERLGALGAAAGIGHDMSNLLLPISIRLDALLHRPDLPPEAMEDIAAIMGPVEYLRQLSKILGEVSRNPNEDWGCIRTELSEWLRRVHRLLQSVVPSGIELFVEQCPRLVNVSVPAHALSQVLLNLVRNAVDATVDGGRLGDAGAGRIEVRCDLQEEGAVVKLSVHDNGPGMTEVVRQRCLQPFYTTKAPGKGTGLGLALVHGIAVRAGGSVTVESTVGVGTTVAVYLPATANTL